MLLINHFSPDLSKNGTLRTTVLSVSEYTPPKATFLPNPESTRDASDVVLIGGTPFIAFE
nr:hypothetical protein [Pseudomonas sp. S07E 245]